MAKGSSPPPIPFSTGLEHPLATQIADLNGDGTNDILTIGNVSQNQDLNIAVGMLLSPCPAPCPADFNRDGRADTADVLAFLNAWNAADPRADTNGDGTIDVRDFLAFLNLWNIGC